MSNQIDMERELPGLIQEALSCDWRPDNDVDFLRTYSCANDLLRVLDRVPSTRRRSPGDRLPLDVLERISLLAIGHSGHKARASIRDTCRKLRCLVFVSQALWSDVATLPTHPPSFMLARTRAWWTQTPLRLHLDNSNLTVRGLKRKHIPSASLLLSAFGHVRSLIVEHTLANMDLLRSLHRQRFFPDLYKLSLSTGDPHSWGPLPLVFHDAFENGVPTVEAPELCILRLRNVLVHLPESRQLADLRLSARTRGSSFRRPRVWNKWPAPMVYGLLARNNAITVLHLIEVIRTEGLDEPMSMVELPKLEVLVICSPSAKEPVWILETLWFPKSTYLGLHIGHRATSVFARDEFYYALGVHMMRRSFRCVTAVSSMDLSGVLLSPEIRHSSSLPRFDETESPLHTTEIAHVYYHGVPGAIDVFIAYQSSWIPETHWYAIYDELTPYISEDMKVLELNPEYPGCLDNALVKAGELPYLDVKELRLWSSDDEGACAWSSLVRGLTGWLSTDETSPREIVELMIALFPDVIRIRDCTHNQSWSSKSTYRLVEKVYRARHILP